jgi:succinoglycan biosynthesis protein ExoA
MKSATASVIVATLNEEANIDHVMDVALSDEAVIELIIADGGSNDTTVAKIRKRATTDGRVLLLDNPDQVQSAGLNRAASIATGDLLVRLDAHTRYASDYIEASVLAWEQGTAVGGPMMAEGSEPWEVATANAMRDSLAVGPARFHHASTIEEVDTVYLGTFARIKFLDLGGYRSFPSGTVEDTDFYARWRKSGGTVVVDPSIKSWYQPRKSWRALAKQYVRYGRGKAELIWLNGRSPSLRPIAPAMLIAGTFVGLIGGVFWSWIPVGLLLSMWIVALGLIGFRAGSKRVRTAAAAATMHTAYGIGLWAGLLNGRPTVSEIGLAHDPDHVQS